MQNVETLGETDKAILPKIFYHSNFMDSGITAIFILRNSSLQIKNMRQVVLVYKGNVFSEIYLQNILSAIPPLIFYNS
jgi:hypothetical protein